MLFSGLSVIVRKPGSCRSLKSRKAPQRLWCPRIDLTWFYNLLFVWAGKRCRGNLPFWQYGSYQQGNLWWVSGTVPWACNKGLQGRWCRWAWVFSDQIDDEDMEFMTHEFVTYNMACDYYGLGLKPVTRLSHECGAVYKIGKKVLIRRSIFEAYLREQRKG